MKHPECRNWQLEGSVNAVCGTIVSIFSGSPIEIATDKRITSIFWVFCYILRDPRMSFCEVVNSWMGCLWWRINSVICVRNLMTSLHRRWGAVIEFLTQRLPQHKWLFLYMWKQDIMKTHLESSPSSAKHLPVLIWSLMKTDMPPECSLTDGDMGANTHIVWVINKFQHVAIAAMSFRKAYNVMFAESRLNLLVIKFKKPRSALSVVCTINISE